ncbi:hypothetical protein LSPH24S_07759 [Lysinibacillus sphaericus]
MESLSIRFNRDVLGYLPEERGIFPTMKVEEQLYFFWRTARHEKSSA